MAICCQAPFPRQPLSALEFCSLFWVLLIDWNVFCSFFSLKEIPISILFKQNRMGFSVAFIFYHLRNFSGPSQVQRIHYNWQLYSKPYKGNKSVGTMCARALLFLRIANVKRHCSLNRKYLLQSKKNVVLIFDINKYWVYGKFKKFFSLGCKTKNVYKRISNSKVNKRLAYLSLPNFLTGKNRNNRKQIYGLVFVLPNRPDTRRYI